MKNVVFAILVSVVLAFGGVAQAESLVESDVVYIGKGKNVIQASDDDYRIDANITATGNYNTGLHALNGNTITINGNTTVTGYQSRGVLAARDSYLVIDGNVTVNGDESYSVMAWDGGKVEMVGDINVTGDWADGAVARNGGTIDLVGNITATGRLGWGAVSAINGSTVSVRDGIIDTTNATSKAIYIDESTVNLTDVTVHTNNNYLVFNNSDSGKGLFNASNSILNGNMYNWGNLDAVLTNGTIFNGVVSQQNTSAVASLTLKTGATWNLPSDATVNGTLDNSGIVNYAGAALGTKVSAEDLVGTGEFIMKTDIASEKADWLQVSGTTSGNHSIYIHNDGSAATTGDEVTLLVKTADTGGSFALTNDVEVGAWKYGLRQNTTGYGTGAEWELYATGISAPGEAAINTMMGSYMLAYAETTLIQRMGDLRQSPQLSGIWVRTYGGNSETKRTKNIAHTSDMDFWGVNIGYDRKVDIKWSGDAYYGVFFGYSEGDMSYDTGGGGNIDSKEVGIYGTYINPNGFYVDSVLKYRWRESDFNTYDSAGAAVEADSISTSGLGWSLEMGQRISFNGNTKNGWYAEPQIQLRHQRHNDGYYNLSNGLRIGTEGFTSIIGRIGALIGYETESRNFYAKVFRAREFDGDLNIYANGTPIDESFGGSWWIYGIGFTSKMNDKHSLYLDLERTSGSDSFNQNWRVNAGWRMEF